MTKDEALAILWSHKSPFDLVDGKVVETHRLGPEFLYATITKPVIFSAWNGKHPVDENTTKDAKPGGTRVIVTMVSRFGDVGIRARNLDKKRHGYDARVPPDALDDWSTERQSNGEGK